MSASRQLARAATRARPIFTTARPSFRPHSHRSYSSSSSSSSGPAKSSSSSLPWLAGAAAALVGVGGWYLTSGPATPQVFVPGKADYQAVYDEIAGRLEEKEDYDDGSYGPVLVRLAWHASGTYDKETGTGGSNGATMRFAPESNYGANAGLIAARDFLEPVKAKYPWISYSDLWILGGVCAIQEMLGPIVPYRPGRTDGEATDCPPDGRLPVASEGPKHIRSVFGRMGFNDQEIVALMGAHALGRCHPTRSGHEGPWTFSPTVVTNAFYKLLLEEKWQQKRWAGPNQFEDKGTKTLMMLPTDMAMVQDKGFKGWAERYAGDEGLWFGDFSKVVVKLFELGVPFEEGKERWALKPTHQQ